MERTGDRNLTLRVYDLIVSKTQVSRESAYRIGIEVEAMVKSAANTNHHQDSDCYIDPRTNRCLFCGVEHGEPCSECGGRGFHKEGCEVLSVPLPALWYDYTNQAWVRDGKYLACSHPPDMACGCYARGHAGEKADPKLCLQR